MFLFEIDVCETHKIISSHGSSEFEVGTSSTTLLSTPLKPSTLSNTVLLAPSPKSVNSLQNSWEANARAMVAGAEHL